MFELFLQNLLLLHFASLPYKTDSFCWALNNESQFIFSPIYWHHPIQGCREGRTLLVLCFPQLVQMKHSTGLQMYWQIRQKKTRVFCLWMNTIWDMLRTTTTSVCKDSEYKFGDLYGNGCKEGDLAVGLCFIYKMFMWSKPMDIFHFNHGLELQLKLKNASGSYGCEGNTERGWGGEPCKDKDKITPLTTVSFYQASLNHSPDNEEGRISIWGNTIRAVPWSCCLGLVCTLQLAPAHHLFCGNWHKLH